ncbi:MAG TPA: TIGR00730 family Rossman fold protein [Bauldia sp.]|nr:TIGR00730 family Rossman fold protein [Bauldia sp.]
MTDNEANKASASYRLPAMDTDYILGDSMRGVRFLLEYAKAEELLRAWGVRSTVVVFGSARVLPGGSGDPGDSTATLPPNATPRPGRSSARWYDEARKFGRIVSERGGALTAHDGVRDNVIATGGGPGIMEAANRGAHDAGAPSIGFNIQLPHEQEPNAYATPDLTFQFHYFAMRKMHFAMRAAALVAFPGGFGTFDEFFELITLVQTEKMKPIPIVCFDREYWTKMVNFPMLVEEGFVAPRDLELFGFADDAEGAWAELVRRGLQVPG